MVVMNESRVSLPSRPIYVQDGQVITTHSMLKTFRRCPKQAQYKYVDRLKPISLSKPLRRGTWLHALIEVHSNGGDWKELHQRLTLRFAQLFDEEKEKLGNLPDECARIMKAYLWHYALDDWKVLEAEFTLEAKLPDGSLYRGKIDLLVEDQFGLWIVDHKSHARLPDLSFRLRDTQSALYLWAALKNGIKVQGHIWNYIKTKPPTVPQILKSGLLSKRSIDTDYLTYNRALKDLQNRGFKVNKEQMRYLQWLKTQQYHFGEMNTSTFFQRSILEKDNAVLMQVATEAYTTHRRMNEYRFDDVRRVERHPSNNCTFDCSYTDLCTQELFGGNTDQIRRKQFTTGDPMDYYYDQDAKLERTEIGG